MEMIIANEVVQHQCKKMIRDHDTYEDIKVIKILALLLSMKILNIKVVSASDTDRYENTWRNQQQGRIIAKYDDEPLILKYSTNELDSNIAGNNYPKKMLSELSSEEMTHYDKLFASISKAWDVFKHKRFMDLTQSLYILSDKHKNLYARYLLGEIFERGYSNELITSIDPGIWYKTTAAKHYTLVIAYSSDPLLISLARNGIDRIVGSKPITDSFTSLIIPDSKPNMINVNEHVITNSNSSITLQSSINHRRSIYKPELH